MSRKVVLVARHFPPLVSGGARRPYLLAKALRERGHTVCIVTPADCPDFECITVPHPNPEASHGLPQGRGALKDTLREWVLWPDADIRWARRASRVALPFEPDWIVTTSPPESVHVAGRILKRRMNAKWLADFRDHWLRHPLVDVRRRSAIRRAMERPLARWILSTVDKVSAVSGSIAGEIAEFAAVRDDRDILVVPNFASDHGQFEVSGAVPLGAGVNVVHTGSFTLSDPGRRLSPILDSLAASGRRDVTLHLVGKLTSGEMAEVEASPISGQVRVVGPVPLEDSWSYQHRADALLLAIADGTPHVPGKLSEYRAAGKPIIVSGSAAWCRDENLDVTRTLEEVFRSVATTSNVLVDAEAQDSKTHESGVGPDSLDSLLDLFE